MKIQKLLFLFALCISSVAYAQGDGSGNLPMGYDELWTARVLFNSEGGYNYSYNNDENPIHGWSPLYEAKSDDEYTILMPTPAYDPGNAVVQFKTPIATDFSHKYTFRCTITSDKDIENCELRVCNNDDWWALFGTTTFSLEAGTSKSVAITNVTAVELINLMADFRFPTLEENTTITIKSVKLRDLTEGRDIWNGTSYFNNCYYYDVESGQRIKDMTINGRSETHSWTEADFDDSMWEEADMPVGNWDYMNEVRTIWPGGDNSNYWIRRTFTINEVKSTSKYTLKVCHDDAYEVYVNGNLLDKAIGWTDGKNPVKIEVPARFLKNGQNVIATYIQQNWGGKFYDCGMEVMENAYDEYDVNYDRPASLIANEIEVANIDQTIDHSFNYGAWIELYNKSDKRIPLDFLYVSDDPTNLTKFRMPANSGVVQPHGYCCIFFDHNSADGVYGDEANKQVNFKLNTDGGTIYISEDGITPFITAIYPEAISRCSYARKSLDTDEWGMNGNPTPNAANADYFASNRLAEPIVDTDSRLFTDAFRVLVRIPSGATLRYTTDGSAPTLTNGETSSYGEFNISETTCLRLRLFKKGYLPSPVVTRSYIYRNHDYYLPVISITTDEANLYDDMIGVYVDGINGIAGRNHGKSNINMDWERPVNFEYITPDNEMGVNMEAEFTISGGWSRHYAPASFKIKATKINEGKNSINYPFFPCKPYNKYKQILIRNGGNDNNSQEHGRVRDAITQETLISSGFYVDAQDYQPVHVFFNGAYIGQLNLREPNNKYNGTANYGYDDDEMDAFEYSNGYFQMAGTKDAFNEWLELSRNATDDDTYQTLRQKVDMDEYINYWAAVSYIGCTDWICNSNNVKGYRSLPDGKFHLTILDQDWGWGNTDALRRLEGNYSNELLQIYNYTKQNPDYQRQFIDAYCILNGSVFTPERCETIGNDICNNVESALSFENKQPWTSFNEQKGSMISDWARTDRMNALRDCFGLGSGMDVAISANIPEASFRINDQVVPTGKFNGKLFAPVALEVSAPAGYIFKGWETNQSSSEKELFGMDSQWQYYDGGSLDGTSWQTANCSFNGWKTGVAPIGYSGRAAINTQTEQYLPTYYFRKTVNLSNETSANDVFQLEVNADDGYVIYVNGVEATDRYLMPEGEITYETLATTHAPDPYYSATISLIPTLFHKGENIIAVEVHNNVTTSSDIYWNARLTTIDCGDDNGILSADRVLNLNSDADMQLRAIFEPLPEEYLIAAGQTPVVINEVSAANSIFVNDYYKRNDWIELYNTTDEDIDLTGMYISDDPDNPHKYQLASLSESENILAAHSFKVIWADKLNPIYQFHAPFKLGNSDGQCVILTAKDDSWTDKIEYMAHTGEESVGRYPDGGSRIYRMTKPTIHASNILTTYSEWISGENTNFDIDAYLAEIHSPEMLQPFATDCEYYTIDGIRRQSLQKGINILRMKDGTIKKIYIK